MSAASSKSNEGPSGKKPSIQAVTENSVAESYVFSELQAAKRTLKWTRIVTGLLIAGALIETIFVAGGMYNNLQPSAAASVVDGLIAQRVNDNSDNIKSSIEEKAPQLIAQIPGQAIDAMPKIRESIESKFVGSLNTFATSSSSKLDAQVTQYLNDHQDEVRAALADGQDPAAVHLLAVGLTQGFISSLRDTQLEDGETAGSKFDSSLTALTEVQQKLDRLAANRHLTPEEANTRHAIALIAQTIGKPASQYNISDQTQEIRDTLSKQ
jgi:hypothetical protein